MIETDVNYIEGLKALKNRDYDRALGYFKMTEKEFAENRDLRILSETKPRLSFARCANRRSVSLST